MVEIFDINAICVGGWMALEEWSGALVPWLLRECQPKANGAWHLTHRLEIGSKA
jgi:DMSO/TMAO reductase YedYZ molybdopterin-dependent catalytic subunit